MSTIHHFRGLLLLNRNRTTLGKKGQSKISEGKKLQKRLEVKLTD